MTLAASLHDWLLLGHIVGAITATSEMVFKPGL
jgi:hypothetical protein